MEAGLARSPHLDLPENLSMPFCVPVIVSSTSSTSIGSTPNGMNEMKKGAREGRKEGGKESSSGSGQATTGTLLDRGSKRQCRQTRPRTLEDLREAHKLGQGDEPLVRLHALHDLRASSACARARACRVRLEGVAKGLPPRANLLGGVRGRERLRKRRRLESLEERRVDVRRAHDRRLDVCQPPPASSTRQ